MPADYITHLSVTCAATRNYVQAPGIAGERAPRVLRFTVIDRSCVIIMTLVGEPS